MSRPELRILTPPKFDTSSVILELAQLRPYRRNGIRHEREEFKGQVVYHNYGHGGAGGSVFYGMAQLLIQKFEKSGDKANNSEIAVLGAGWIGMFTALILSEKGYTVNIYTDYVPSDINTHIKGNPKTASQVSGALVCPLGYPITDAELHKQGSILTFNFLKELKDQHNYPFINWIDCYDLSETEHNHYYECTPEEIRIDAKDVLVDFGNGRLNKGKAWKTYILDSDYMLKDFAEKLRKNNQVQFVDRQFNQASEVANLGEQIVFNCLGLSSGKVFGDPNVLPVQGHHIYLQPTPGADYCLFSDHLEDDAKLFHIFNRKDRIIYGGTFERGEGDLNLDQSKLDQMRKNFAEFFNQRSIMPQL